MMVVTGMHRSGTSLAALVLRELGVDFGAQEAMYDADDWNAHGYLERSDVVDLNSRLLTGFERTTGRVSQVASQGSYLLGSVSHRRLTTGLDIAPSIVAELITCAEALDGQAVKDPRFCLTLDTWKHRASIEGLVVALRHPSAAVASLRTRNRLPTALGHRFWQWHMQAVLPHIDDDTLIIRQDELVGGSAEGCFDEIRRWLAVRGIAPAGDPHNVIDTSLVHHRPDDSQCPEASLRLWEQLCNLRPGSSPLR